VAVTKTWPVEVVRAAVAAGLTMLGENRVQEAEDKIQAVPEAEWHLIGRLQSNKARRAIRSFSVIHSVDSFELLGRLDAIAAEERTATRVLLQVNVSGERAKAGLAPDEMPGLADAVPSALTVIGLMTMAPMGVSEGAARAIFSRLRHLRDGLEEAAGIGLPELSMGMTADADAAAAEGATLVRIGTALFGHRA
jgi:pyridoxal phosphate enzyme (YggS family)